MSESGTSESKIVVLKFGGTSVASRERWEAILEQARARRAAGERPVLVCSAISQVTNTLERLIDKTATSEHEPVLERVREIHTSRAEELGVDQSVVSDGLEQLSQLALGASLLGEVSPRVHARVLAWGELLSTRLGAAFLDAQGLRSSWVDARECLAAVDGEEAADERRFLNASCAADFEPDLRAHFDALFDGGAEVVITQGFLARAEGGETVLLGRGGSDTSASLFAAKLGAARCEIWTDVPGMFTTNPREVPAARLLRRLDYDEAQELATTGAKVLHPRCILPCKLARIPLSIHSTLRPDVEGTVIADTGESSPQVKAISKKTGVMLVSMDTLGMWQQVGFLSDAFAMFKKHGISVDLVSTSESNVTASLDLAANAANERILDGLIKDLNQHCQARLIGPCAAISLVGQQIRGILHELGSVFRVFEERRVHLMSQAASDLNLTFVVDEDEADRLVSKLHQRLVGGRNDDPTLGPTWKEFTDKRAASRKKKKPPVRWWQQKREALLALAEERSPLFVYDEERIHETAAAVAGIESVDRAFFAIKANPHPGILEVLDGHGIGFECVSPGEVAHVREHRPDLPPERILFTPNFAPQKEYDDAFALGVNVTVDNLHPLAHWPDAFKGKDILLRLDPGRGRGHHAHVRTAGAQSKFGIAPDEIEAVAAAVEKAGARVVGLHAHAGSGIRLAESWSETASFLAGALEIFSEAKFIDVGGGLGVPEKPGQDPLDLAAVDGFLAKVKEAHPGVELWMEPGRFFVAEAGVLLAKVTQVKKKGDVRYVGIDAGMNTLIRPALYGAFHEIVNLSRLDEPALQRAHVVGPICETGDTLGHGRRLPPTEEGDVLLIATTGAYGRSMSSRYNLREPAAEHLLGAA
jgi:diaminopimelate decarboxylase/aspartate kinase